PENDSRNYKVEDGDLRWQFDRMPDIVPLVHFADQPCERSKQESGAAAQSWRNREHWNRRQPKCPPNWMKPGAEICERRRYETGRGDEKTPTRSHLNIAKFVAADGCSGKTLIRNMRRELAPIAKDVMLAGRWRDSLFNPNANRKESRLCL